MKMGKVKEFCKKHKSKIFFIAGASIGVLATTAAYLTTISNLRIPYNARSYDVIKDAKQCYPDTFDLFSGRVDAPLKAEELGTLGEKIIELGGKDNVFTHFIAIGPDLNNKT